MYLRLLCLVTASIIGFNAVASMPSAEASKVPQRAYKCKSRDGKRWVPCQKLSPVRTETGRGGAR